MLKLKFKLSGNERSCFHHAVRARFFSHSYVLKKPQIGLPEQKKILGKNLEGDEVKLFSIFRLIYGENIKKKISFKKILRGRRQAYKIIYVYRVFTL